MKTKIMALCLSASMASSLTIAQGFLHADGRKIVDGSGKDILLRGMGFGGWMLQEPYMLQVGASATAGQHSIFEDVEELIGAENMETYRQAWLANYCTAADVAELKNSGFNSLRVPLHYNLFTWPAEQEPVAGADTWLEEGFVMLDSLLSWCVKYEVYLILDLHAAPGGQGIDANISDYDVSKPSLWESAENQRKTTALWGRLAQRYAQQTWVGGYDLLNEPNWKFDGGHHNGCDEQLNAPIKTLYAAIIEEIRRYDQNHIIFLEGNCWANNHNGLWPVQDDNVALSFHRYWNENRVNTIQWYLDLSAQHNIPLWMGESGENNDEWYEAAVRLLEDNNIGWAWWTWKKMNSGSGSYSITAPEGYETLQDYWANGGEKPDAGFAFEVMMQLAENVKLENCTRNDGAINALTKRRQDCSEKLYDAIGGLLEAEDYCDMFGIQSENTTDDGGGQNAGWLDDGDWLAWNVHVEEAGNYLVEYRVASQNGGGGLQLESFGGVHVFGSLEVPQTGEWQNWQTVSHQVQLPQGELTLALVVTAAGFNINWLRITSGSPTGVSTDIDPAACLRAYPNPATGMVHLSDDCSWVLYSAVGSVLSHGRSKQVDLTNCVPGLYFIEVQGKSAIRVVKQHTP